MGDDSLLERVTAAAQERQLSHNSLIAYRRTWLKIIAWAAAEGLVLETFPGQRIGEFYEECISKRGLANEVNGLSFLCPPWKSLKQKMQMGSPYLIRADRPNDPPDSSRTVPGRSASFTAG